MQFTVASGIFLWGWFGWGSCHRLRVRAQRWLPEHPGLWRRTSGHHWGPWWYPVLWSHQLERWNPMRPGRRVLTKDHQESTPKSPERFYLNPQHLREILMKKVILVASNFILQILSEWSMLLGCTFPFHFLMYLQGMMGLYVWLWNTENALYLFSCSMSFCLLGKGYFLLMRLSSWCLVLHLVCCSEVALCWRLEEGRSKGSYTVELSTFHSMSAGCIMGPSLCSLCRSGGEGVGRWGFGS